MNVCVCVTMRLQILLFITFTMTDLRMGLAVTTGILLKPNGQKLCITGTRKLQGVSCFCTTLPGSTHIFFPLHFPIFPTWLTCFLTHLLVSAITAVDQMCSHKIHMLKT